MNEKNEIVYLDDNNNIVEKEVATHAIIREYDENGNLINETFMVNKNSDTKEELNLTEEEKEFLNGINWTR